MAREPWLGQVTFTTDSNNPADFAVNTWHFHVEAGTTDPWTTLEPLLNTFYQAFDNNLSASIGGRSPLTKWYNLADTKPRAPRHEGSLSGSITGGADDAPPELTVCLSYKALYVSGTPKSRRRGRIYLGPWAKAPLVTSGRVDTNLTTAIATAASTFMSAVAAESNIDWIVYSPTEQNGHEVNGGWVDDAWDIQRRRGTLATTRTTFGSTA